MDGVPDYTVRNLNVKHQQSFDSAGRPVQQTLVSFTVGDHGPFMLTYNAGQDTAAQIRQDIQAQVAKLQDIAQVTL